MSLQVLSYLEEMKNGYLAIMKKYVDKGELSELDILFLEAYKRTIDSSIVVPSFD
jgi:hypothetical protein